MVRQREKGERRRAQTEYEPQHRRQQAERTAAQTGAPQYDVQMPSRQYGSRQAAGKVRHPRCSS